MADNNFISFLKLRGSYGITGNSEIAPYSSLGNVGVYTISLNDQIVKGTGPVSVPNPNLKWEQTAQTDIGVDLRVLDNRLNLTADYYKKKTTNLLLNVPISSVTGYTAVTTNIGSLQNTGFELAVSGDIIRGHDLGWSVGAQLSSNTNKILALGTTNADIFPGPNFLGQTNILQVGKPIGNFWGFQRIGTWVTKRPRRRRCMARSPVISSGWM
ncbi:TonB-dependent receptor domain-containing protein [Puia sp. P3]|uniref:TonB-dependent receptor domain-containing protein n=1 Tax=Puia sp. P3 TaxID=3423952 RepID=UPI003D66FA45